MVDLEAIRRAWKQRGSVSVHYRGAPRPEDVMPLLLEIERLQRLLSGQVRETTPTIRTRTPSRPWEVPVTRLEEARKAAAGGPLSKAAVCAGLEPSVADSLWAGLVAQLRRWGMVLDENGSTINARPGGCHARGPDALDELLRGK